AGRAGRRWHATARRPPPRYPGEAPSRKARPLYARDRARGPRRTARAGVRRLGARARAWVGAALVALAAPCDGRGGLPRIGAVGRICGLDAPGALRPPLSLEVTRKPPSAAFSRSSVWPEADDSVLPPEHRFS